MIIGFSSKKGDGKDTAAEMWQYLECMRKYALTDHQKEFSSFRQAPLANELQSGYAIKKYAGKLKERLQMTFPAWFNTLQWERNQNGYRDELIPELGLTRRQLITKEGTDVCRAIHPDYWVHALMNEYKDKWHNLNIAFQIKGEPIGEEFPNWLITDVRFPNEVKAIKDRGGIIIRIKRTFFTSELSNGEKISVVRGVLTGHDDEVFKREHSSETALDDFKDFDFVIDNDSSLEDLLEKVEMIYNRAININGESAWM